MKHLWKNIAPLMLPLGLYHAQAAGTANYVYSGYARNARYGHALPPVAQGSLPKGISEALTALTGDGIAVQPGRHTRELIIIDASVPDKSVIYQQLSPGVDVVEIRSGEDGLAQLAGILAEYQGLDAIHLFSHAEAGTLVLGNSIVNAATLQQEGSVTGLLDQALKPGGDLLLYGCNVAADASGTALLEILSADGHIDVAASTDLTGSPALGGDWDLEIQRGLIDSKLPFSAESVKNWRHVLATLEALDDFTGSGTNTLTENNAGYFTVTGSTGAGAPVSTTTMGNNFPAVAITEGAYVNDYHSSISNQNIAGHFMTVTAGGPISAFKLTAITFVEQTGFDSASWANMSITGYKQGGGTVTGTITDQGSSNTTHSVNLTNFTGIPITKFKIQFDTVSGTSAFMNYLQNFSWDPANTPPTVGNFNGDSLSYNEGAGAVIVDQGTAATVTDTTSTDFNGGSMTLTITAGEDAAEDRLSLSTAGTVTLGGTTAGSNVSVSGNVVGTLANNIAVGNDLKINFNSAQATPANVQTLVRALTFENTDTTQPTTGARTLSLTIDDGDGGTSTSTAVTATVTVNAVNDEPTLSATGGTPTFTEGGSAVDLFSSVTASTIETGQTFSSLTLTVTNVNDGSNERLVFDGSTIQLTNGFNVASTATNGLNVSVSVSGSTATVSFSSATLSAAAIQTLVDGITYTNLSNDPNTSNRVITLTQLKDSGGTANSGDDTVTLSIAATVTVVGVNDEPTLTATGNSPTFTEGGSAVDLFSTVSASTVESGQTFTSLTLTVTNVNDGSNERLVFDGSTIQLTNGFNVASTVTNSLNVSVSVSGSTATVSFSSATLSAAAIQTLVDAITYQNLSESPNTTSRVVTITQLKDSGGTANSGDDTATLSLASTVTVASVNDEPTLTATGGTPTFTEGGSAVDLFSSVTASTIESGQTFTSLTLTVTNVNDGSNERLVFDGSTIQLTNGFNVASTATNALNVSVSVSGSTATVSFSSATLSAAAIQTLVDAITYQNLSESPNTSNRVVTITQLKDSGGTANSGDDTATLSIAATVTVVGVNDEPTLTATGTSPTFTEGGSAVDLFSTVSASTVESGQTFTSLTLTVTNVNDGSNERLVFDGSTVQLTNGFNVPSTTTNSLNVSVSVSGSTATVSFSSATLSAAAIQTLVDSITYQNLSSTPNTSNRVVTLTQLKDSGGTANSGDDTATLSIASTVTVEAIDTDGNLTAAAGVTEPVGLGTLIDTAGEAVDVFDFTLSDGGTSDGKAMTISAIVVNVSGTSTDAERGQVTWRLNGSDVSNKTGVYSAGADTITFSGLSISVANSGSEVYTVNAFYNDNTNLVDGRTVVLTVDGDTDVTEGASGTQMGTTSAVDNGAGTTINVVATALAFKTQPAGSVSGTALTTQPVVAARDAFGNTDRDFGETITLTEASLGTLANATAIASNGEATFSTLTYTATADQQAFVLTANDEDGTGTNLPTVDASSVTSNVVATKLLFQTEPVPLSVLSTVAEDLTTDPVVRAVDANSVTDTGYATAIVLSEVNGSGSAALTATGDSDGSGATVTIAPASGVTTFTNLQVTYTNSGGGNETFNLRASSGGLTTADSSQFTSTGLPTITDATYNASTGTLVVTGTNFQANGGGSDIDVSDLTLTGEGGSTHTLNASTDVEIDSATQFTVTLHATDKAAVNQIINKNGTTSTGSTTYNLAAADDFITAVTVGNTADATSAITASAVAAPTITSATYNASTGALVVTGTGLLKLSGATNDVDVSKLTLTGEGGSTYTLTTSSVEITNGTSFTVTLNGTDLAAVNQIINKDLTTSTSGTTYNLAAAEDWAAGADAAVTVVDATGNGITASSVAAPTITSATYNASTGALVVTGTGLLKLSGATNDIDVTKLTLTGEGGTTYTLTTGSVEITNGTGFTVTLNGTDLAAVNLLINKNGTASTGGTTYNLAAAEDWAAGADAAVNVVDATGNGVTASNVATPTITSATYNANTGALVVTGAGLLAASGATNDIDASKLTLTGEGGSTYTLTDSADVEISSGTAFTVTLSATDKAAVNLIVNKNGTSSTGGTTYNLAAAEDWAAGADPSVNIVDATGNGVDASNVAVPAITGAAYDFGTRQLVLTGTGFLKRSGATNDVDVSTFTITGEGGSSFTLASSADVEITSGTSATVTLTGADIQNVAALLNKDGTTSATSATTYNLAAAEDWNIGADGAVTIVDGTITLSVSNYAGPTITSATYNATTGALVVTGTNLVPSSGATNDVDASLLTLRGGGNETYALTDSADVEISSATSFTVTLSATDRLSANGVLNKNGTSSGSATTYNLEAADNWMTGSPAGNDVTDTTGNAITVSNTQSPTITSATYDTTTNELTVTGTNLVRKVGAANDVDLSTLTFTGGVANATYTLVTATDVEITSATSFLVTLSGADETSVEALLDQIGTASAGGSTYNLAGADNWLTGADASANIADATSAITVTVPPTVTSSTYNHNTGVLVVTGTNFQANGSGADIDASLFTFTGEGGATYTLTDTADVERDSVTQFTLTLSATDKAAINLIVNKNGLTSTSGTTYNLAAADNYVTAVTNGNTADATNAITASNVAVPTITSATYDANTGALVVTGTGLLKRTGAANDIDVSKLTITGEGGAVYTLTDSADVEITSATAFTVTLSAADKAAVNLIVNKNGTASTGGTTYNLAAAEDWATGADAAVVVVDAAGNGITAGNVAVPAISSVTYEVNAGTLSVTGTGFVRAGGAANDIDASAFTLRGGTASATYTLTDTTDVEVTSGTSFIVTLSATDKTAVNLLLNQNGTISSGGTTYNLGAAEDWAAGADAAVTVADTTIPVTVEGIVLPVEVIDTHTDNDGQTLTDVTITETGVVEGGTLDGDIDSEGTVRDVELTAGTTITGGTVEGTITGDPDDPALINSHIAADAVLENIIIGEDATIDPDATLNGNVRFESLDNIPPGLELSGALDNIPWDSKPDAILAVNLSGTVLADSVPGSTTLLESIRMMDEYNQPGYEVEQDPATGELIINGVDFQARLVPTEVYRVAPGTEPGTTINEDGNIEIVTETGFRIVALPAVANPQALQTAFTEIDMNLDFDTRGNIQVQRDGAPVSYTGRPVATAVPAFRSTVPGLHFYEMDVPLHASGVSLIYEDENGMLWEQELVPVPADWPTMKRRLAQMADTDDIHVSLDGVVSIRFRLTAVLRGRPAYVITPGSAPSGSSEVIFLSAGDLNGDGTNDFTMLFPNGDRQALLILP